jgi:SPX domain protein involved in polyphosphate accumulation
MKIPVCALSMSPTHQSLSDDRAINPQELAGMPGRREWKYIIPPRSGLHRDDAILRLCPLLRRTYPSRYICNVYFDTPALKCYADNLNGISERTKVRIRWYGDLNIAENCTLELKKRRNQYTWKSSCPMSDMDLQKWDWDEVRQFLLKNTTLSFQRYTNLICVPTLITRYRRQYYEVVNSNVRVTIDSELEFLDQRNRAAPNLVFNSYNFRSPLLELKFPLAERAQAISLTNTLNLRRTRFSKYSVGMECVSSRSQRDYR